MEIISEDEGIYEGETYYGKRHGVGVFHWNDGGIYNGEWHENRIEGYGIMHLSDGRLCEGHFLDYSLDGQGSCYFPNHDCYHGQWERGVFHGTGVFYSAERGEWELGTFSQGNLTKAFRTGKGMPLDLEL